MLINVVFFNKSLGVAGEPFFHLLLVLCFAWENSNLILLLSFPLFASFTTSPSTEWWSTPATAHCCVCSQERVTLTGNLKTSFIVPGHSWVCYMAVEIFNVVRTVRAARPNSYNFFCCCCFRVSAALTSRCWIHLVMPYKFDKDSSSAHTNGVFSSSH